MLMEYSETDFVQPDFTDELSNIKKYFNKIGEYINSYEMKIKNISEKMISLSGKNYIDDNSSLELLKYQKKLIQNEKQYLDNLNNIYKAELNKQIYIISEKTTIMFMSLQNINKEIDKDFNISKQLRRSFDKDEYKKMIQDTIYNFSNIKSLLLNLKAYNIKLSNELENDNFHCKTLGHNINKKRILIYINYKKMYETFVTIIRYFADHSEKLMDKLKNDTNYTFLVNNDKINDSQSLKPIDSSIIGETEIIGDDTISLDVEEENE